MGRRHTAGVVGSQAVGGVQVDNTTFTAAENSDIVMDPSGTGRFVIAADAQLQAQADLRFADADSSHYVAFQAPATVTSNVTWTLPSTDGTASQAIVTNGTGVLSFAAAGAALTDNTTDSSTNFVNFTTLTSGFLTDARVSTTKLTFQPSTGTLTSTAISTGTLTETSSIIYKQNVNSIEDALEKILHLTGVIYDRKDGSRDREPGLIAEEVEKIIPNVITYRDGKIDGIMYTKIVAYLIESVKTLNTKLELMKKK